MRDRSSDRTPIHPVRRVDDHIGTLASHRDPFCVRRKTFSCIVQLNLLMCCHSDKGQPMFVPDFPPPAIIEPVQYAPDPWVAGPNPALVFGVEAARRAQARALGYIVPELAVLPPVAPPP